MKKMAKMFIDNIFITDVSLEYFCELYLGGTWSLTEPVL